MKSLIDKIGYGFFAIEIKNTSEFISFIGLADTTFEAPFTPCTEIGWRLHRIFWKKGYATEGVKAVLDFAFRKIGKKSIISYTSNLNFPSITVMKQIGMVEDPSCSFEHPKIPKGHPLRPHVLYRLSKEQFFRNKINNEET